MDRPTVRDRSGLDASAKKMELVAPEEIAESLIREVDSAFSLTSDQAIQGAARRLGFSRVAEQNKRLVEKVLASLINSGRVQVTDSKISIKR